MKRTRVILGVVLGGLLPELIMMNFGTYYGVAILSALIIGAVYLRTFYVAETVPFHNGAEHSFQAMYFRSEGGGAAERKGIRAAATLCRNVSDRAEDEKPVTEPENGGARLDDWEYIEILDDASDGSWVYDVKNKMIICSDRLIRLVGAEHVPRKNFLDYCMDTLMYPQDIAKIKSELSAVMQNREPRLKLECRIKTNSGRDIWLLGQCRIRYDKEGMPLKVFGASMDISERKLAEVALQENVLLLRAMMDNTLDYMFIKDKDSRFVMVNAAYGRVYNVDTGEVIGKNEYEIFGDPEKARDTLEKDRLVMESGRMLIDQESVMTNAGLRTFSLSMVPWRDTQGNVIGVLGTAHDITELKEARDELQELVKSLRRSNECIELLYETTERILSSTAPREDIEELCVKVMDFLNCQVFFNYLLEKDSPMLRLNACGGISDKERERLEHLPLDVVMCGCAADAMLRIIIKSIKPEDVAENAFFREIEIRAYACYPLTAKGKQIGTLCFGTRRKDTFNDEEQALMKAVADSIAVAIERKQSEDALQESEKLLRAIIDGMEEPVFLKDKQGRTLLCNEAVATTLEVSMDDMMYDTVENYNTDQNCAQIIMENDRLVMENNRAYVFEERVQCGPVVRTFLSSKSPWRDAQGNVIGMIGVARDITERIEMEGKLRRTAEELAEKNTLVTDFFINISHEFKTPISVLQLAMDILREHLKRGTLNDKLLSKNLKIMVQNTYRLSKLVSNLLDITKIDAGFLQPMCTAVDIDELLKNLVASVKPYAAKRGLKLTYKRIAKNKRLILTDPEFVERIVTNLMSNAIKNTQWGGTVAVSCEENENSIILSLRDNGKGIPKDKHQQIFDRFRQTNNTLARSTEGCGIGLSLCKSLTELLGGRIWFESEVNQGSLFVVELPATQPENTVKQNAADLSKVKNRIMTEFSDINFER